MSDPVTHLLDAMQRQDPDGIRAAYAADARLLASVPGNFYDLRGPEAIADKLSAWYASWEEAPAHPMIERTSTGRRTVVELERTSTYEGARWVTRQVHVIDAGAEGIREHRVYCSGPHEGAPELAEARSAVRS